MSLERWLTNDARALIAFLDDEKLLTNQNRQVCLFCHACCTRLLPKQPPPVYFMALQIMLEAANGKTRFDDLNRIGLEVMRLEDDLTRIIAFGQALNMCFESEPSRGGSMSELIASALEMRGDKENEPLSNIVRDIFGSRYYRITIDPRWQSSVVLDLARTIEVEQCYERLPILADALMDAGCDDETLLEHCRDANYHVKGCWALDLILEKA